MPWDPGAVHNPLFRLTQPPIPLFPGNLSGMPAGKKWNGVRFKKYNKTNAFSSDSVPLFGRNLNGMHEVKSGMHLLTQRKIWNAPLVPWVRRAAGIPGRGNPFY